MSYEAPGEYTLAQAIDDTGKDIDSHLRGPDFPKWIEALGVLRVEAWDKHADLSQEAIRLAVEAPEHKPMVTGIVRRAAQRLVKVQRRRDYELGLSVGIRARKR